MGSTWIKPIASTALLPTALVATFFLPSSGPPIAESAPELDWVSVSESHSAAGFDLLGDLDIIDHPWMATVKVERPNEPVLTATATLDNGQTEDAVAARIAFRINKLHDGAGDIATVKPVPDGPNNPGQIDPRVARLELALEPFQGTDLLRSVNGPLIDSLGVPSNMSRSVLLAEGKPLGQLAQEIVTVLENAALNAPNRLVIEPSIGGPKIFKYLVSIGPAVPLDPGIPAHFGLGVNHEFSL